MQEILSLYRRFTYILGIISRESRVEQATHSSEMIQVLELSPEKEIPFKSVLQTALLLIDLLCFKISPPIFFWLCRSEILPAKIILESQVRMESPLRALQLLKNPDFRIFRIRNPDFSGYRSETISCRTYKSNRIWNQKHRDRFMPHLAMSNIQYKSR